MFFVFGHECMANTFFKILGGVIFLVLFLGKVISFLKAFTKDMGKRNLKHSDKLLKISITINVECSNILEKILDMMEKFIMERYV